MRNEEDEAEDDEEEDEVEGKEEQARLSAIRFLKQGSLSPTAIAEGVGMSLDFVLKIQKELEKKSKSNANSL